MKLWIARNKDGILYLHYSKPERDEKEGIYIAGLCSPIPYKMFPEVTWENSPREVEIKLI